MKGRAAIFAAFLGAVAIITWRDFTNRDPDWPLPVPPPYRYVGAAVAFGMLSLVAEFVNEKVPAVLAMGLLVGLGFQTAQSGKRSYNPDPGMLVGRTPLNKNRDMRN